MSDPIGPEHYTLYVCEDCGQPAHGPGSRCGKDRRRTWTRMVEVEYVRADLVRPRCQHCPSLADERSFMCEDHAFQADGEVQVLRDRLRECEWVLTKIRGHLELLDPPQREEAP